MGSSMGIFNLIGQLVRSSGLYGKSLLFFLVIAGFGGWLFFVGPLNATDVPNNGQSGSNPSGYDITLTLTPSGDLYSQNSKLQTDKNITDKLYQIRYQVLNKPENFIDSLTIAVSLPKPITEDLLGSRFRNNGGAETATSQLLDSQTIVYTATQISTDTQLVLELEVPKAYLTTTALSVLKEKINSWSPAVWLSISIALPLLTLLILFITWLSMNRRVPLGPSKQIDQQPSRLTPAMLGILLNGRLSSRELAATLLDLARRGHLVIRQVGRDDFRFTRHSASDKLEKFESQLLEQIFGPSSDKATSEEVSFALAQELFSKRVSEAFLSAYQQVNDLGFFYTNPLRLHRRYQVTGIALFVFGLIGFFANVFLFEAERYLLLFWLGMMASALLVTYFSRDLPSRTVYGDRELGRWLAFRNYLTSNEPISYQAQTQDRFLAYLPYAVVLDCEVEWTRRFYDLPFAQPHWYVADGVHTIDEFANKLFPLFGYLSHALAISTQPATR